MPTVLRVGVHWFFFSNEGNEPPHVHVETGDSHAKFRLNPVFLSSSVGYGATELRELREIIVQHRDLLEE